jgi:hypothetical protein
MKLNAAEASELATLRLDGGIAAFQAPLGRILLPPDKRQWPKPSFIKRANRVRLI